MGVLSSRETTNSQILVHVIMKAQTVFFSIFKNISIFIENKKKKLSLFFKDIEKRLKDKFLVEALETLMNMNDIKEEVFRNIST